MDRLQEIERSLFEGDMQGLQQQLEKLQAAGDYDALYDAAALLVDYGFIGQAETLYAELLQVFPDEAQLKIDRAKALIELGEEDEALLLLTEIDPADEEYVQALLAQADYYQLIGMAETAAAKVREAAKIAPHEPVIQLALAELLLDAGRYSEAVRIYRKLHEQAEELAGVPLASRIAEAYSAGAAYEEAIPYYESLLEKERYPEELFGLAFAYFQTARYSEAVKRLTELTGMDPDYFSAYMLLGQSYLHEQQEQQALEAFQQGIARDAFDKELHLAAGKAALKLQKPEEAVPYLQEALALDPEYVEALVTLASFYHQQQDDESLIELLEFSKAEQLDIPLLHSFLAEAYERTELYEKAYEMFSLAYDGMKEDSEFLDRYARFLLEEGKRSEAQRAVVQLVKLNPQAEEWIAWLEQFEEEV